MLPCSFSSFEYLISVDWLLSRVLREPGEVSSFFSWNALVQPNLGKQASGEGLCWNSSGVMK